MTHATPQLLKNKLDALPAPDLTSTEHKVFMLSKDEDRIALQALLEKNPNLVHHNEIASQCRELVKISNPTRRFSAEELENEGEKFLAESGGNTFGNYVHYPWSNKLVRILPEKEFVALRTSRNKYKITEEEQAELAKKTVGVIGLSVGQSVAITMATERVFGTLRIADFDILELSNLNRIRKGLDYLGSTKTAMVVREIAEVDPYLKVEVFSEGITPENIDNFIGGKNRAKLDLLVEECDSFPIKIMARVKARAQGIPVVMDTSDRGMIDIERFDLEPNRPLFHGAVDGLEQIDLQSLTQEQRMGIMMQVVNYAEVSDRMKKSYAAIGKTLTTWPQLASSVVLGGAAVCDISRRILLQQTAASGRFYLDVEALTAGA